MAKKKKNIELEEERYGLFMSDNSFDLDISYGRDYLKTDNVQYVVLHRINAIKTKKHKLYGQTKAKDKAFFAPVRLNVMLNIEDGDLSYYGDGGISRHDTGKLIFGIYNEELEEKDTEITRGDIIEYNMSGSHPRYYEVEDADEVSDTTSKSIGGFKSYWKRITSVPVKEDVVPFLNETKGD